MRQMRIPLILALVLISLLSLVNVSAFRQGTINSGMSLSVRTTGVATLKLAANPGTNSTNQVVESGGMLNINFGAGVSRAIYALQRGRTQYTYALSGDDLTMLGVFTITNNSTAQCVDVSVYATDLSSTETNLAEILGRPSGGTWQATTQLAGANGAATTSRFKLGKAGSAKNVMLVDFHWTASNTVTSPANQFNIEVLSTNGTCPP